MFIFPRAFVGPREAVMFDVICDFQMEHRNKGLHSEESKAPFPANGLGQSHHACLQSPVTPERIATMP